MLSDKKAKASNNIQTYGDFNEYLIVQMKPSPVEILTEFMIKNKKWWSLYNFVVFSTLCENEGHRT